MRWNGETCWLEVMVSLQAAVTGLILVIKKDQWNDGGVLIERTPDSVTGLIIADESMVASALPYVPTVLLSTRLPSKTRYSTEQGSLLPSVGVFVHGPSLAIKFHHNGRRFGLSCFLRSPRSPAGEYKYRWFRGSTQARTTILFRSL